jgi:hypothetical protein
MNVDIVSRIARRRQPAHAGNHQLPQVDELDSDDDEENQNLASRNYSEIAWVRELDHYLIQRLPNGAVVDSFLLDVYDSLVSRTAAAPGGGGAWKKWLFVAIIIVIIVWSRFLFAVRIADNGPLLMPESSTQTMNSIIDIADLFPGYPPLPSSSSSSRTVDADRDYVESTELALREDPSRIYRMTYSNETIQGTCHEMNLTAMAHYRWDLDLSKKNDTTRPTSTAVATIIDHSWRHSTCDAKAATPVTPAVPKNVAWRDGPTQPPPTALMEQSWQNPRQSHEQYVSKSTGESTDIALYEDPTQMYNSNTNNKETMEGTSSELVSFNEHSQHKPSKNSEQGVFADHEVYEDPARTNNNNYTNKTNETMEGTFSVPVPFNKHSWPIPTRICRIENIFYDLSTLAVQPQCLLSIFGLLDIGEHVNITVRGFCRQ